MSAPLRFLAIAILGWVGLRAATLGMIPGTHSLPAARAEPPLAVATQFPPLDPVSGSVAPAAVEIDPSGYPLPPWAMEAAIHGRPYPVYYPYPEHRPAAAVAAAFAELPHAPASFTPLDLEPPPQFYSAIPQLDEWPLSRLASASFPERRSAFPAPAAQPFDPNGLDRLQLTAWALLRGSGGGDGLASGGTLGGSQAGARLTYALDRSIAASLRSTSPVGGSTRGGEVAAGVRFTPFRTIPVSLTAERRQALGRDGGRSAFALFAEGGVYQRPLPWSLALDGYFQAGVVGARRRDLFADGAMTVTRPVHGRFSAGFGVWGGVQPGIYRVDGGPRISMRVRRNMRVDLDWRQRLAGHAEPGSGPAITLAGDF